eukprot:9472498-Pyramimonas_sp.AAC.1
MDDGDDADDAMGGGDDRTYDGDDDGDGMDGGDGEVMVVMELEDEVWGGPLTMMMARWMTVL